jgi:predicted RNA binding protein YcfA (HicA-like mRNA interferase family)
MPRKIRQLIKDLQDAGYVLVSQQGSHRKFKHAKKPGSVILSATSGEDAKPYQEKQVRNALSGL